MLATQQQQPGDNAPNPMAALSHLMAELAGVQRALLAQQAVPSTPPSGAQQPADAPWATPGYRMRQPAWDAEPGDGTPQHRAPNTGSATKPPLSGGRMSRGGDHAPAVEAASPGLTRRSLLLQRVQQQAAGHGGGDEDEGDGEEEGSVQTSPEEWARSGGRAPSRSSGTFSFREDRPRAASQIQAALAAEQAQNDYLRRLLARAEEVRDAARADAATLRERALATDVQLRQLLETLDARDAEALSVRARLRNDKARMVALQAERDQAVAHLRVSHDRGQLLHRVLGLALAACFVMALRLLLGTRPTGK